MCRTQESLPPSALPAVVPRPRARWALWIGISTLVLLWLAAMLFRTEIRARWWAYRLGQAEDTVARRYYTACLAAIGDRSLPATRGLLDHPRPPVRLAALEILHHCPAPGARDLILAAVADPDDGVSDRAALELALRPERQEATAALQALVRTASPTVACKAVTALHRLGEPETEAFLLELLGRTPDPDLLAQAIDALGLLGSGSAVPRLIDCLADDRSVARPPASHRWAEQAILAIQDQLPDQGVAPAALLAATRGPLCVADVAERALTWITGIPGTDLTTQPAGDRSAAIQRWRQWHQANIPSAP